MDLKLFAFGGPLTPEEALARKLRAQARRDRDRVKRRWVRPSDWLMHFLCLLLALLSAIYTGILFERFTPEGAARHLMALGGCGAARAAGVAGAARGELGYWPINDLDGNGVACER